MAFMICFIAYMLRANIAINMLAMVETNKTDPNVSVQGFDLILFVVCNFMILK